MSQKRRKRGVGVSLLYSFIVNFWLVIPGIALLVAHYVTAIPLFWSFIAFGIWILCILLWILAVAWISFCSSSIKYASNKNPYSVGMIESAVE